MIIQRKLRPLLSNQLFKLPETLLDNPGNLFRPALRFQLRIMPFFAELLFRGAAFLMERALDLLPCAVWHLFNRLSGYMSAHFQGHPRLPEVCLGPLERCMLIQTT